MDFTGDGGEGWAGLGLRLREYELRFDLSLPALVSVIFKKMCIYNLYQKLKKKLQIQVNK